MEKETLEEAAERFADMCNGNLVSKYSFITGAKWQSERMYSEEDMKTLFAKTLESSPSTDSHTRMISDTEYRHFVMDKMYNRIIKSLQQTKWQAGRMYSEEEVKDIIEQTIEKFYKHTYADKTKAEMKELWFEQLKNK